MDIDRYLDLTKKRNIEEEKAVKIQDSYIKCKDKLDRLEARFVKQSRKAIELDGKLKSTTSKHLEIGSTIYKKRVENNVSKLTILTKSMLPKYFTQYKIEGYPDNLGLEKYRYDTYDSYKRPADRRNKMNIISVSSIKSKGELRPPKIRGRSDMGKFYRIYCNDEGVVHRDEGPAIECLTTQWYKGLDELWFDGKFYGSYYANDREKVIDMLKDPTKAALYLLNADGKLSKLVNRILERGSIKDLG
jgi:hypothetical protein